MGPIVIEPKGRVRTNDAEHIRSAVLAGLGLAHSPSWLFATESHQVKVVRLLKDYAPPMVPIHAMSPGGRRAPGKVKVFVDFLAEVFAAEPHLRIR